MNGAEFLYGLLQQLLEYRAHPASSLGVDNVEDKLTHINSQFWYEVWNVFVNLEI